MLPLLVVVCVAEMHHHNLFCEWQRLILKHPGRLQVHIVRPLSQSVIEQNISQNIILKVQLLVRRFLCQWRFVKHGLLVCYNLIPRVFLICSCIDLQLSVWQKEGPTPPNKLLRIWPNGDQSQDRVTPPRSSEVNLSRADFIHNRSMTFTDKMKDPNKKRNRQFERLAWQHLARCDWSFALVFVRPATIQVFEPNRSLWHIRLCQRWQTIGDSRVRIEFGSLIEFNASMLRF